VTTFGPRKRERWGVNDKHDKQLRRLNCRLREPDWEIIDRLQDKLGVDQADVVRIAVRRLDQRMTATDNMRPH